MGESKNHKQPPNRFEIGSHGGCEAALFEFSEKQSPELRAGRIEAIKLDEALACLRWHEPASKSRACTILESSSWFLAHLSIEAQHTRGMR